MKMDVKESKRGQKLYYYLSRLSPKELKDLHAYFSSPLLGNSLQMARMLLTIQAEVLDKGGKVIDAELFQTEFFPDQALDDNKRKYIRIRLVQFLERVLDFVAFMEYKGDTNAHHVHLLKAMHTRGWEKYFERTYQEIEAMPPKKDFGEYHLYRMRREIVRNDHLTGKATTVFDTNLVETLQRVDIYIAFASLKYACAAINANIHWHESYESRFASLSIEIASDPTFNIIPEIKAYAYNYQMLVTHRAGNPGASIFFYKLKSLLSSGLDLDKSEATELFSGACNYCNWMIKRGELNYVLELRDLYNDALACGTITSSGIIQKNLYWGIANQMCKLGETQWSLNFVEEWKNSVAGDPNNLTYYVIRAMIHLVNKEYEKTIELLYNRIGQIEEPKLNLNARLYICRAAWEKGDYQWLTSLLLAFRSTVRRSKGLTKDEKLTQGRFIELFTKMCNSQLGKPDQIVDRLEKIKLSMESNSETKMFFWLYKALTEKLDTIKNKA